MRGWSAKLMLFAVASAVVTGSGQQSGSQPAAEADTAARPGILANNVFVYYADVEKAWAFYRSTLGLETVADFGFAKILRAAGTSYITLVDATKGMHTADEPKTVTLAFVTEQVEDWFAYLQKAGVPMRSPVEPAEGRAHDGFVAIDPEGYLLEFERFNPHAENDQLMPILRETPPLGPAADGTTRPSHLMIAATVWWLYYKDVPAMQRFYEEALGVSLLVDQGWAKVYRTSPTGYIGLVDETRGLHRFTEKKGVSVSFLTDDIAGWFAALEGVESFRWRNRAIGDESGRVRTFVGYDPEGYYLEFDEFIAHPGNARLRQLLEASQRTTR